MAEALAPINILSSNIRGWTTPEIDGEYAWKYRLPEYIKILERYAPHLIGYQEFMSYNLPELQAGFPHHEWHLGPPLDEGLGHAAISWDRRFQLANKGGFWLKENPSQKGKGWDAAGERAATWAELKDSETDKTLLFVNTHLDNVGEQAQKKGTRLILDFIKYWPESTPIIVTGDFNSGPPHNARPYGLFAEAGFMDMYRSFTGIWPPPTTFHDYKGDKYTPNEWGTWYIDWPMARNLRVLNAEIIRYAPGSLPPSDHYFIYAQATYTGVSNLA